MSVELTESNIRYEAAEQLFAEAYDEKDATIDARRRLENKIEDMRLQKELSDFDFDI